MKRIILLFLIVGNIFAFSVQAQQKELTNKLIWATNEFGTKGVYSLHSMDDGEHYTQLDRSKSGAEINQYNYKTGEKVNTLLTSSEVFPDGKKRIEGYEYNEKEDVIIVKTGIERIYRYSQRSEYYLIKVADKSVKAVSDFSKGKIQLGSLAPGGKYFAYVRDNDLYYVDLSSMNETRITTDGKKNEIINGLVDWVYEEEFDNPRGFHWSSDGKQIAFYHFDERNVKSFSLTYYGDLYPEDYTFKYPKAGEENSKVEVRVYDLDSQKTHLLNTGNNEYIPRIKWTTNNRQVVVMVMNRHQDELKFLMFDTSLENPEAKVIYSEKSETYIEINNNLIFLKDGERFVWNSSRDDFNHIYLYNLKGQQLKQLTTGNWDVIDFLGVDEKRNRIYFTAAAESPINSELYYVGLKDGKLTKLSTETGINSANFNNTFDYYINTYSNAGRPPLITLHNYKGKLIRTLKDNQSLIDHLKEYKMGGIEFFSFTTDQGIELNAYMIKPTDFDPTKKYPVLFNIYGGPGHNTVKNSWGGRGYLWNAMMAEQGIIVVSVDPRGTMYRGRKFLHSTYMQLGNLETQDLKASARYMASQKYVDGSHIGIFGWSYGGFMALNCITRGADEFSTAVSVAPVTNWRYYDNIYTERYMRTPQENASGYDDNSPINHADEMRGKLLLVHGDADDNVHVQNTMDMISAFVKADKQFELFIYPNKNHGIYGGNTRNHLFEMISSFLKENL